MRMLDLFCGRGGWTDAFLARGWEVVGVDIVRHPDYRGEFIQRDVMELDAEFVRGFDFACASSPCEQFSLFRMKHFHPNPPYPDLGIRLFEHTRAICEASGVPYVMENVYATQKFVGRADHHCGPFYLWGSGVPMLLPQGIRKGISMGGDRFTNLSPEERRDLRKQYAFLSSQPKSGERKTITAKSATIPTELAGCVADYAFRMVAQMKVGMVGI